MTDDQRARLLKAIERAERPGGCIYCLFGKTEPICVIAQLVYLEGGDVSELDGSVDLSKHCFRSLEMYPGKLLQTIQRIWDGAGGVVGAAGARRMAMVKAVNEFRG